MENPPSTLAKQAAFPVFASVAGVLVAGVIISVFYDLGPQSRHMAIHIAAMNVAAPILAFLVLRWSVNPRLLWLAAAVQIVVLWAAHAPPVYDLASSSPGLAGILHAVLFLVALVFWYGILGVRKTASWHSILALILTGKLACLLAALLIFAPRALYAVDHAIHPSMIPLTAPMDDQQLAGLIMISACPISYLVAAIILCIRMIIPAENADDESAKPVSVTG